MRLLTKAEACRELRLSLSTLDRRIAAGELQARREPHGRRHRVYVVLDDDPPSNADNANTGETALAVAQERRRNAELVNNVKVGMHPCEKFRPWWRLW